MPNKEENVITRLFSEEIPEVAAGVVELKAIARRPGVRCKIALYSHDQKVDAIGVCVGIRGSRIRKIVAKLGWERIDMIRWEDSIEKMIKNALQPAQIESVTLHPSQHRATVVVKEDNRSLALGREGINRELASKLCSWEIAIVALP